MIKAWVTQRSAYFFLLILGAVFLTPPLFGLSAQTTPSAEGAGTPRASSTESIAEVATSTAVSAVATSTTPRPSATGSIPVLLPIETKPAETLSPPPVPISAPLPEEDTNENTIVFGAIAAAFVAVAIAYGVSRLLRKNTKDKKDNEQEDQKCKNIKTLLEQKKKELEDMVRGWPKEKLQEITKDAVLGELKKDKNAKKILDIAESAKEKYDKLKEVIEMLQKKYDLCAPEFSVTNTMKVILVDAVGAFVVESEGVFKIFKEMHDVLESFTNRKIILTGVHDEQFQKFGLDTMPYEVFTLEHNPEKTDPEYYEIMLKHFGLGKDDAVYFEHNPEAVKSAQSVGIKTYHYDPDTKDLQALKAFLTENL